jgi:hypothetical protein
LALRIIGLTDQTNLSDTDIYELLPIPEGNDARIIGELHSRLSCLRRCSQAKRTKQNKCKVAGHADATVCPGVMASIVTIACRAIAKEPSREEEVLGLLRAVGINVPERDLHEARTLREGRSFATFIEDKHTLVLKAGTSFMRKHSRRCLSIEKKLETIDKDLGMYSSFLKFATQKT